MIKKLLNFLLCIIGILPFCAVNAQNYQAFTVTSGYNADVIANGIGSAASSTTMAVDNADFNFMANNFQSTGSATAPAYALPATGLIPSLVTPGLNYQLGPLTGSNSLRIATQTSGTLAFSNPISATKVFVLITSGSGTSTIDAVVNFSDATSQPLTAATVPDWFSGTALPTAASGFGRVSRLTDILENPSGNPRMYQLVIDILPANQTKPITSVQFTKTSTAEGVVNVFAVSADVLGTCPSPSTITVDQSSLVTTGISWTVPVIVPAGGYDYYLSTVATAPVATTTPTGTVTLPTVTLSNLILGTPYYFWVRSNCSATDKGPWQLKTFTPGLVSYVYAGGEISSMFQDELSEVVTVNSFTPCPGTFTVNVPVGYKIASVGTSYTMTTGSGAYQSEQRSLLRCITTNTSEAAITTGPPAFGGTATYSRTGLNIANNATGAVQFELRVWRVWGDDIEDQCGVVYNKVDAGTWAINVTLESLVCTPPAAPNAPATQSACATATVANLTATGVTGAVMQWYTAPTGGTALAATTALVAGNYYVAQKIGNCESATRTPVAVTLLPATPLPTATSQTLCAGNTITNLVVTGTTGATFKWYAALTGGVELATTTPLVAGNYFVSQTVAGCESLRLQVAVQLTTTALPTAVAQGHCVGASVANLIATPATGGALKWYTTLTGGTELVATTPLASGNYYVSQTIAGCTSSRLLVVVTVTTPTLPVAIAQTHCSGNTVANLTVTGTTGATFKWYTALTGGTELAATTPLAAGNYFVSQTINGCESARLSVTVTVTTTVLPTAVAQTHCSGATVANLTVTGTTGATFKWYAALTGGTALVATTPLASGNYFVSQTVAGCESLRLPVVVTTTTTALPTVDAQTHCAGATVANLTVTGDTGATFKWYAALTGGVELTTSTTLVTGNYFVSQTVNGCESARKVAIVTVAATLNAPIAINQAVCTGSSVASLTVTGQTGATFNWYSAATGGTALAAGDAIVEGTYYVSQTVGTCESIRIPVIVTITVVTDIVALEEYSYCGDATIADITIDGVMAGATVEWYSGGNELLTPDTVLVSGTYFVSQSIGICESAMTEVVVIVNPIPNTPTGENQQDFEEGETVAALEVETIAGAVVSWYILDEDVYVSIPVGTVLEDGVTYYVKQVVGTCESEMFAITVNAVLGRSSFDVKNLMVYPNPATDVLTVSGKSDLSEIVVRNLLGQEVMRQKVSGASAQINISGLSQASYILQVYAAEGASASIKIVKK